MTQDGYIGLAIRLGAKVHGDHIVSFDPGTRDLLREAGLERVETDGHHYSKWAKPVKTEEPKPESTSVKAEEPKLESTPEPEIEEPAAQFSDPEANKPTAVSSDPFGEAPTLVASKLDSTTPSDDLEKAAPAPPDTRPTSVSPTRQPRRKS